MAGGGGQLSDSNTSKMQKGGEKVKKLFSFGMLLAIMLSVTISAVAGSVRAETRIAEITITQTVVSDTTNEWWDGAAWQPAVACWVYPDWPSIPGATWIWRSYKITSWEEHGPVIFRKGFTLPENAFDITGSIQITADNAYELYLNGRLIGRDGFVTSPPIHHKDDPLHAIRWKGIETYNFVPQPGENEIIIKAVNYRSDIISWRFNPAGLIYRADISYKLGIKATIDFDPDTLSLKSKGKWVTVYIELPEGYDVNDINVGTVMLNYRVPAEPRPTGVGDHDDDGIPDLMVKFDRAAVQRILPVGDEVKVTVTGQVEGERRVVVAGIPFEGSDFIRVIDKEKEEPVKA
jgi:hypothetical protein